jgi:ADP-heptose:LPS heptosyltransferase
MIVPVVTAFLEAHPKAKVSILTKKQFVPLFVQLKSVEVIGVDLNKDYKGVLGLIRLSKKIKNLKVDAIADLHNVLRTKILHFLLLSYKWSILDKGRLEKKQLISGVIFKPLRSMIERYADVIRNLGFVFSLDKPTFPKATRLSKSLETILKKRTKPFIGIAPFAAYTSKTYPFRNIKSIIETLSKTNWTIILFGGGQQEIEKLNLLANKYDNVISAAGQFSIEEELQLMAHLKVMLAMDSGNAHMAAMVGIKVITLWGVTHPYSGFIPFNQPLENCLLADREQFPRIPTSVYGNHYPKGYEKAIESISKEDIIDAIQKSV